VLVFRAVWQEWHGCYERDRLAAVLFRQHLENKNVFASFNGFQQRFSQQSWGLFPSFGADRQAIMQEPDASRPQAASRPFSIFII